MPLSLQINDLLNFLTQSIQSIQIIFKYDDASIYTNIVAVMEDFIVLSKINYAYIAPSQSKFVLSNLSIVVNLSKYEKILCFLCKGKKVFYSSFFEDEWFLYSGISTHFTLF